MMAGSVAPLEYLFSNPYSEFPGEAVWKYFVALESYALSPCSVVSEGESEKFKQGDEYLCRL